MKIGLVITCYNRPEYLSRCLESIKNADSPKDFMIIMYDDHSNDAEALRLFHEFNIDGVEIVKYRSTINRSVSAGLLFGYDTCFNSGCEFVINIDNDAIVKKDFIEKLIDFNIMNPGNIVTGFNCMTRNKNGSERHTIIKKYESYYHKASVGGINMCMCKDVYLKYMKPSLEKVLKSGGNWDHMTCLASVADSMPIVVLYPSVVQHIGLKSSMGHDEQPDVADDFDVKELTLDNVTLIGIDCVDVNRLIRAAEISCKHIKFGAVKLLTHLNYQHEGIVKIPHIKTIQEYSKFMIKDLYKYVDTEYCLVIQHDGYVLDYSKWQNEFLCDYIGATWWYKDNMNVGNGGFSLRSKKLLEHLALDPKIVITHPEDDSISRTYRKHLEEKGIVFASQETANRFSIESAYSPDKRYSGQFGFHGHAIDFSMASLEHIPVKPLAATQAKTTSRPPFQRSGR